MGQGRGLSSFPVRKRSLIALFVILAVIMADQIVKFVVKTSMSLHERIDVTSWFQIFFTENQGMAFGMDFVGTMGLTLCRVVALVLFIFYLVRLIRKQASMATIVSLALVIAGAVGNVIDNCLYGLIFTESPEVYLLQDPASLVPIGQGYGEFLSGRVVDMFYFPLWRWPDSMPLVGGDVFFSAIFNVADAAITCGAVALFIIYYMQAWKESKAEKAAKRAAEGVSETDAPIEKT